MSGYHLAQVNIARGKGTLDSPAMRDFAAQLDSINSLAERSPGFVWRYIAPVDDDTVEAVFGDPLIVFNMSVWESVEALYDYAFRSDHRGPMRDRRRWFTKLDRAHAALWWVPVGSTPSVHEARERLRLIDEKGATSDAFTFSQLFDSQGRSIGRIVPRGGQQGG